MKRLNRFSDVHSTLGNNSIFTQAVIQCANYSKQPERLQSIGIWFEQQLQSPDIRQDILKAAEQGQLNYTLNMDDLDPRDKKYMSTFHNDTLKYLQNHIPPTIGAFHVSYSHASRSVHASRSIPASQNEDKEDISICLNWK